MVILNICLCLLVFCLFVSMFLVFRFLRKNVNELNKSLVKIDSNISSLLIHQNQILSDKDELDKNINAQLVPINNSICNMGFDIDQLDNDISSIISILSDIKTKLNESNDSQLNEKVIACVANDYPQINEDYSNEYIDFENELEKEYIEFPLFVNLIEQSFIPTEVIDQDGANRDCLYEESLYLTNSELELLNLAVLQKGEYQDCFLNEKIHYFFLFKYLPVRYEPTWEDEIIRKFIWDFKSGHAVKLALRILDDNLFSKLSPDFDSSVGKILFCVIPASTKYKNNIRYKKLCQLIWSKYSFIDNGFNAIEINYDRADSREHKSENVVSNLSFNKDIIRNRNIILFDDIITRGTSFLQCRKALLESGANSVIGLFLGKTISK